ncbi:cellulose synthase subunit BcsC-related outer membrane protein [Roseicella frigidaeris]|uniref:Cellulose synthase operon C C-terminal domain-containing protein n=1 Tax=Roseicella frigidaeris TaxID=2230885 RepID=A0A327MB77_9PROT|nr:cellulose synthase subunit BcsC-related outer membrane protein [Roseicella frigidaeris]RAI59929.1 hypothetical protein DOO78_06710 [Roseicella frigidaeris]
MEAAIAQRDWDKANALLVETRAMAPDDARVSLMKARIARAAGQGGRAPRALERAQQQMAARGGAMPAVAIGAAAGEGGQGNPFRTPAPGPAASLPPGLDPVAAEVARELTAVREETAGRLQATLGLRVRSGTAGLDRLGEVSAAQSVALPGRLLGGQVSASVTPVAITTGQIETGNLALLRSVGTNALAPALRQPPGQAMGPSQVARDRAVPRDDSAAGVALGLAYSCNAVTADIGTTPLGFRQQAVIGGVELAPALNDTLRLRVTAGRRAVTDSLLAWAEVRDPNSGQSWGGVTRHGGRVQLEIGSKPVGFYVGGGYAEFRGDHVAKNSRVEAGAGAAWSILRRPEETLIAGLDLVYFGYDNNQRLFTYGNGGYFSPQSYVAANIPLDWRRREDDLAWRVGGTIGYQAYKEDAARYFPLDPGLQAQAETAAAGDPSLRAAQPSATKSGVTGGVRGDIEYAVTGNLKLGGLLRHDRTGDWNEARGLLFARYRFGP